MKKSILLYMVILSLASCKPDKTVNESRNRPFEDAKTRAQVDALYGRMTIDEKIMQLCGIRPNLLLGDDGKLKNGIDMTGEELQAFIAGLQHFLTTETPSKIPAIFHEEAITGFCAMGATIYPQHIGVACSWNPALVEKKSKYTAQTMRSIGSTMALSPMLDVCKTVYFERMEEGFGEDPYLTGRMGLAFVNGLQHGGLQQGTALRGGRKASLDSQSTNGFTGQSRAA
jgi:beta-glucosidase